MRSVHGLTRFATVALATALIVTCAQSAGAGANALAPGQPRAGHVLLGVVGPDPAAAQGPDDADEPVARRLPERYAEHLDPSCGRDLEPLLCHPLLRPRLTTRAAAIRAGERPS